MEKLRLYIRYEMLYLLTLIVLLPLPLGCFFHYSEFKAPGLSYTLIGVLFTFQYFFFDQRLREKKLEKKVTRNIERKLGKVPPHKVVHRQLITISGFRIATIMAVSFIILILSIIYNRLTLF